MHQQYHNGKKTTKKKKKFQNFSTTNFDIDYGELFAQRHWTQLNKQNFMKTIDNVKTVENKMIKL